METPVVPAVPYSVHKEFRVLSHSAVYLMNGVTPLVVKKRDRKLDYQKN